MSKFYRKLVKMKVEDNERKYNPLETSDYNNHAVSSHYIYSGNINANYWKRRVWTYQRGNQNPCIEEEQTR